MNDKRNKRVQKTLVAEILLFPFVSFEVENNRNQNDE